jgi:single-strand DNA-binding protein
MLRVTVMGYLGSNAQVRYSAKGLPIVSLRLAVDQLQTNATGERTASTEWFGISVVGRQAESAAHLQKGQRVLVAGRLQISHFQRRDGTQGIGFDVWADAVQNLSPRSTAEAEDGRVMADAVVGEVADELADLDQLPF